MLITVIITLLVIVGVAAFMVAPVMIVNNAEGMGGEDQ
ncbi:membrane protein [Serratia sp. Ag1]|nr:membrane protein [Serratia sp. Ag2]KFK93945.1 membrane protein [Serratia sp. Ag1]